MRISDWSSDVCSSDLIGLLQDIETSATIAFKDEGKAIFVIGQATDGSLGHHLGQSLWLRELHGREDGPPPHVDLAREKANGDLVRRLIAAGKVQAFHDVSDDRLLIAAAEMALAGDNDENLAGGNDP